MAAIHDIITDSANKYGVDPAFALSVAERESNFNPYEGGYGTIRGLFQFTRALRHEYGISEGATPQQQADAFMRYTQTLQGDLKSRLGRDATNEEVYYAHHFGPGRAAGMVSRMHPGTPVSAVFTPYELQTNPHIVRAGTVGNLLGSVGGDMSKRMEKFGGSGADLSKYGSSLDADDLAKYGTPLVEDGKQTTPTQAPAQPAPMWKPSGVTDPNMPFDASTPGIGV